MSSSSNSNSSSSNSSSSNSSSSNSSSSNSSSSSSELYHDEIAPRYIVRDDVTTDKIIRNDESTNRIIIAPLLYEPTIGVVNFAQPNYSGLINSSCVHAQKYYEGIQSADKTTAKDDCYSGFLNQLYDTSSGPHRTINSQLWSNVTSRYQYRMSSTRYVYDLQRVMSPYRGETIHELINSFSKESGIYQGNLDPEIRVAWYLTDVFPTKYDFSDLDDLFTLPYFSRNVDQSDTSFKSTITNIDTTFRRYLNIYVYWENYNELFPTNNNREFYDYAIYGYLGMRWL
jgi:hypothetical protein